jgi:hypothetical protein
LVRSTEGGAPIQDPILSTTRREAPVPLPALGLFRGACGAWSIISNPIKDWATSDDLGKMAYFLDQLAIKEAPNTVGLSA